MDEEPSSLPESEYLAQLHRDGWVTDKRVLQVICSLNGFSYGDEVIEQEKKLKRLSHGKITETNKAYVTGLWANNNLEGSHWRLFAWRPKRGGR
jgi:hypothetical protein